MAVVNSLIAAGVALVGVVILVIVAPQFALWFILAALFVTVPPILIVVRDMRERSEEAREAQAREDRDREDGEREGRAPGGRLPEDRDRGGHE